MDQVLGNEHNTNPPIIIAPIANNPIVEATSKTASAEPVTPVPGSPLDEEDPDSSSPFISGKKVKQKKNKSDAIIDLMMQSLEIKDSEIEERKKEREERKKEREAHDAILARAEAREQKLVDFLEVLVKHIVQEWVCRMQKYHWSMSED